MELNKISGKDAIALASIFGGLCKVKYDQGYHYIIGEHDNKFSIPGMRRHTVITNREGAKMFIIGVAEKFGYNEVMWGDEDFKELPDNL